MFSSSKGFPAVSFRREGTSSAPFVPTRPDTWLDVHAEAL